MRRLVLLVVLVGAAGLGWLYRDALRAAWNDLRGAGRPAHTPSPELAEAAEVKLAALAIGDTAGRVALSEAEVQSLVRYRLAGVLPSYVIAPEVELLDGRIRVRAQVPTEEFPRVDELGDVVGFLPDTAEVMATGQLIPLDGGRVGMTVEEMSAARILLPRGLIPTVLRRLGRRDEPGLPPAALPLPLPAGASTAYIRGDSVIFIGRSGARMSS